MTKTAMAHKELRSKEDIAARDRATKASIAAGERESERQQRQLEDVKSKRQLTGNIINAVTGLVGGIGSGALGYAGRMGAAKIAAVKKNDPEWYLRYSKNVDSFVNIPLFTRLGDYVDDVNSHVSNYQEAIPGIQVVEWAPAVGPQPEFTLNSISRNPINQILMRSKEQVLKLNSRSSVNWEAADLGLNIFCTREILNFLLELKRAIGVALLFSADNMYLGNALLSALGFDAYDFRDNLANYKQLYEMMRLRFNNAIVAPKSLSVYDRCEFLSSHLFCDVDANNGMKQIYIYRHIRSWQYLFSTADHTTGTGLNTAMTFGAAKVLIDQMITAIVENPDFVEMYADLRHAIGDDLYQLEGIPMDYTVGIWYSKEILNQFKNTITIPSCVDSSNYLLAPRGMINGSYGVDYVNNSVYSLSNGYLYQGDNLDNPSSFPFTYAQVTVPDSDVSTFTNQISILKNNRNRVPLHVEEDFNSKDGMLVLTRNMTFWDDTEVVAGPSASWKRIHFAVKSCGTEIFTKSTIYVFSNGGTTNRELCVFDMGSDIMGSSSSVALFNQLKCSCEASKFDWMYTVTILTSTFNNKSEICGDFNKYALVSKAQIDSLHTLCSMSEHYLDNATFKR